MTDFYDDNPYDVANKRIDIKKRSDLRNIYYDFLRDFREHLVDFVQQSMAELVVAEIPIHTTPVDLFNEQVLGRYITVKNQGKIECYISTGRSGGYRLDPGEKERFWLNKQVTAVTVSGMTVLGLIQS